MSAPVSDLVARLETDIARLRLSKRGDLHVIAGDIREAAARISELEAALAEMTRLATSFTCDEIDYMLVNKLGDPEEQHNVKWARKLGITVFSDLAGGKRDG